MGRKKLPISMHEIKGNPSRLTLAEIEERKATEVQTEKPEMVVPSYLTAKQKREFLEYAEQLDKIDIYSDLDRETLAAYVVAVSEWQELTKRIRTIKIKGTSEEQALALSMRKRFAIERDRAYKILRASASDLGLTITSRCKLVIPQVEEPPVNKFSKFLKEG